MTNRLQKLRKQQGLTQTELARRAQITRSYLSAVENGKYNPTTEVALRLARVLGRSVNEVFFDDGVQHAAQSGPDGHAVAAESV